MARKKISNGKEGKKRATNSREEKENRMGNLLGELKRETKYSILAVGAFVLALVFILSYFDKAGTAGRYANKILDVLFGKGSVLVPTILFFSSFLFFRSIRPNLVKHAAIGATLFLFSALGSLSAVWGMKAGGYVGYFASYPFMKFFDLSATLLMLGAVSVVSILLMANIPLSALNFFKKKETDEDADDGEENSAEEIVVNEPKAAQADEEETRSAAKEKNRAKKPAAEKAKEEEENYDIGSYEQHQKTAFVPPPLSLLEGDRGKPSSGDIKANANIIKRTLQNFGIDVEMAEINIGPSVTQYTLKPAEGVKLARILALQNDLALSLAAHPLRIEAPIPGRSLVGIEIPNSTKTTIGLASLFSEEEYQASKQSLLIAMGKDVAGKAVYSSIAKMPHLLVAGATGSGKSIFIHTLITSLLYRNSPEILRFIMVDPKRVELTVYNQIPHMLAPVITETKKAIMTLKWLCKEMERRYEVLLSAGVRDIGSYHEKKGGDGLMPYLVVVIDELADLMSTYPREMEASIVRLAQMSRAVGIHLVLSTQRPSVEVITGLIKANITCRVALQVASQIDSRTILDMAGAEKLLGKGDMLFLAGDTAKPKRIQGPFISENEVKKVVDYLADQYKNVDFESAIPATEQGGEGTKIQPAFAMNLDEGAEDLDELYEDARQTVIESGKASTSYLQRKLKIGYARAARLIDMLEERGVVGPGEGAKARQVLIRNENEFEGVGADTDETSNKEQENEEDYFPGEDGPELTEADNTQTGNAKETIN
ncbi:MAG: hypothetical protein HUT38_01890 [Candidatus Paceibacter sp.]|nr:hypothetical protein [Candidatus Paceibacter sp.]